MTKSTKCARPACECLVSTPDSVGKYCSERCREAGLITELRCDCPHPECRHPELRQEELRA
jgi:hypothetical protein